MVLSGKSRTYSGYKTPDRKAQKSALRLLERDSDGSASTFCFGLAQGLQQLEERNGFQDVGQRFSEGTSKRVEVSCKGRSTQLANVLQPTKGETRQVQRVSG